MKILSLFFRFCFFLSVVFLIILLSKGWHLYTSGFRKDKIYTELTYDGSDIPLDKQNQVRDILKQKFYFLDRGCQTYVFLSADKQYVLKFIRYHKYELPFWMHYIEKTTKGKKYRDGRLRHRVKRRKESLKSYSIAYQHLQKETGIVYAHLNQTSVLKTSITVYDRLHHKYCIDADNVGFLIQKRATPLTKALMDCKKNQDDLTTQQITHSFFEDVDALCKKGIVNRDYNCLKNSGIIDGQVVQFDLGSFYYQKGLEDHLAYEKEVKNFTKHYRRWAVKYYANLVDIYDEELQRMIKKNYEEK